MDAETVLSRVGLQLRTRRKARGLTQMQLAERAGLPRLKVVQAEAGTPSVSAGAYARLAAALGCEVELVAARRPTLDEVRELLK